MRALTRRVGLGLGLWAVADLGLLPLLSRRAGSDESVAAEIVARPIASFHPERPGETRFGALTYRSGLVLTSATNGFGGFSGLWRDPLRPRLVAIGDHARWLTAEIRYESDRLAGLADARISPVLGEGGIALRQGPSYDCESLAMADGIAYVGIERTHQIRRFDWGASGPLAEGRPIPVPRDFVGLDANGGIEALAIAPAGHPLSGALLAFAEVSPEGEDAPVPAWVVTGPDRFAFRVAKTEKYRVTDAAFLATGELLLLERSFSPLHGAGCRIRRFARDAIRAGETIDGEVIVEADRSYEIDNMECLAVHRAPASGETVLTLMSDDNFMPFQRTLLLEFTLAG